MFFHSYGWPDRIETVSIQIIHTFTLKKKLRLTLLKTNLLLLICAPSEQFNSNCLIIKLYYATMIISPFYLLFSTIVSLFVMAIKNSKLSLHVYQDNKSPVEAAGRFSKMDNQYAAILQLIQQQFNQNLLLKTKNGTSTFLVKHLKTFHLYYQDRLSEALNMTNKKNTLQALK